MRTVTYDRRRALILRGSGGVCRCALPCTAPIWSVHECHVPSLRNCHRRIDRYRLRTGARVRRARHAFLDQDFDAVRHVIDTNITGTIYLIQKIGREMRGRGAGRILITGSVAGYMPGSFHAVYNGTKAFIDSFSYALRNELKDSGVTVTCLMPGATETEFFKRADLTDTQVGQAEKDDPADVAKVGFDAMLNGEADVVAGFKNKVQTTIANVTPNEVLAEMHRKQAEPHKK